MDTNRLIAISVGVGVALLLMAPGFFASKRSPSGPPPADQAAVPAPADPAADRPAPPIALKSLTGQDWSLAALRDKRAALVVFWASW